MSNDNTTTMKPEEAIIEIRTLQLKHNGEIKQLQQEFKSIEQTITKNIEEMNSKIRDELNNINQKIAERTNDSIDRKIGNMKMEVTAIMEEHIQKIQLESKVIKEQNLKHWSDILKEIQEIKTSVKNVTGGRSNNNQIQQPSNSPNSPSLLRRTSQREQNNSSPTSNNEIASIHSNLDNGANRIQTILLPPPTTAPIFHGNPTERPWQFLIRIEEYTETVHMWGEDMLLRGISQFLKDNALEWYCQLRTCHYLPKTWSEFKQAFIAQFNSPIRIAQQQQQWDDCKQRNDEAINEFIIRLRALWVEKFPHEEEEDLAKHLFCKMRPEILNIMGCPRNVSLPDILNEAQRIEEIVYHRKRLLNQGDELPNNNYAHYNRTHELNQQPSQEADQMIYRRTQGHKPNQQQISCYHCGRLNHRASDYWYRQGQHNYYQQQTATYPKNQ